MSDSKCSNNNRGLTSRIYITAFLGAFSTGLYQPFINVYAVELGATYNELGIITSVGNAAPTIFQPIWGHLSDKMGRRLVFVFIGYFLGSILIAFFLLAENPLLYAMILGIQSIIFSASIPAWSAFVGDQIPEEKRGKGLGILNGITFGGRVSATMIAGVLMTYFLYESLYEQYLVAFIGAALTGVITSFLAITLKEVPLNSPTGRSLSTSLTVALNNGYFKTILILEGYWMFAMSLSWPYFAVVMVNKLQATKLEIAIASILFGISFSLTQMFLGNLIDVYGRRRIIFYTKFIFPVYPIFYVLAESMIHIYIANVIVGMANALTTTGVSAYILDITGSEERGTYFAIYNTLIGATSAIGSVIGGFLGWLLEAYLPSIEAMNAVLIFSFFNRIVAAFLYKFLKESPGFPIEVSVKQLPGPPTINTPK